MLISEWVCIGAEGKTIDGREINREWLFSAAKNYNPEFYNAVVWCEHNEPGWRQFEFNLGHVHELKTEEIDGVVKLFGRLSPNSIFIEFNKNKQKQYPSIELQPNFPNEGDMYLASLAATDQPASTWTSQFKFSKQNAYSFPSDSPIQFGKLNKVKDKQSFFSRCFNFSQSDERESTVSEEQLAELLTQIAKLTEKIEAMEKAAEKGDPEEIEQAAADVVDAAEKVEEQAEEVTDSAEYSRVITAIEALGARLEGLEKRFSLAEKKSVTRTPSLAPAADVKIVLV